MSRIARPTLRQLSLIRTYATPQSTPVSSSLTDPTPPSPVIASTSTKQIQYSDPNREYPVRKRYLYDLYGHLIKTSPLFLIFEYDNLTIADMTNIRNAIAKVPIPPSPPPKMPERVPGKKLSKKEKMSQSKPITIDTRAQLTVIRTGVFSAVAKKHEHSINLDPWLNGQRAIIYSEFLSPPYLKDILSAVKKSVKSCEKEGAKKQPKLNLVVGLVEDRLMPSKQVEEVSKLPDMQTLRSQIVGTMEMPGRSVLGLLGQAGGAGLLRTLQGLEQGMKEKEGGEGTEVKTE